MLDHAVDAGGSAQINANFLQHNASNKLILNKVTQDFSMINTLTIHGRLHQSVMHVLDGILKNNNTLKKIDFSNNKLTSVNTLTTIIQKSSLQTLILNHTEINSQQGVKNVKLVCYFPKT